MQSTLGGGYTTGTAGVEVSGLRACGGGHPVAPPSVSQAATESVSLISGFYTPQLLPSNHYPVYDVIARRWVVPESAEMKKFPNERGSIIISARDIELDIKNDITMIPLPTKLAFNPYAPRMSGGGGTCQGPVLHPRGTPPSHRTESDKPRHAHATTSGKVQVWLFGHRPITWAERRAEWGLAVSWGSDSRV